MNLAIVKNLKIFISSNRENEKEWHNIILANCRHVFLTNSASSVIFGFAIDGENVVEIGLL